MESRKTKQVLCVHLRLYGEHEAPLLPF